MLKDLLKIINSSDLKGKFVRGGLVLTGGTVFENGARLVRNMILARLLVPEYFGLMATIMAATAAFEAFTEVGVRQAVIQNKKGNLPQFLNAAWWLSTLRGLSLFITAFLTAPFVCTFYNKPELLVPLKVCYLSLLFNGAISPRIHILEKELRYPKWVMLKQGSAVLGVTVSIVSAIYLRNIWPLVLGYITEYAVICLMSYVFCPFRPRLSIDRPMLGELLRFARGMFGLPVLTAIFLQIDVFAIGKLVSMEALGLYSLARNLASMPIQLAAKSIRPLALPTFSHMQDDKEALQRYILRITELLGMLGMPFFGFCIVFAKPILSTVYGSAYAAVSIPFSIIVILVMIRTFSIVIMQLFFALGRPNLHRKFALFRTLLALCLIYPAIEVFGLNGAASTVLLAMFGLFLMQLIWTRKLIGLKVARYLSSIVPGLWLSGLIVLPGLVFVAFFPEAYITGIAIGLVLCFIAWAFAVKSSIARPSLSAI